MSHSMRDARSSLPEVDPAFSKARSLLPGAGSSMSDECPSIPIVCLGDGHLGVLLGHARAFSRMSEHLRAVSKDTHEMREHLRAMSDDVEEMSEDLDAATEDLDAVWEHLD